MTLDIPKNTEKAIEYLTKLAELKNQFAQYVLGKLFLIGKDVPKNKEKAVKFFTLSAEQGNEYEKFFLDNMEKFREPSVGLYAYRMFNYMSKIFEDNIRLIKIKREVNGNVKIFYVWYRTTEY